MCPLRVLEKKKRKKKNTSVFQICTVQSQNMQSLLVDVSQNVVLFYMVGKGNVHEPFVDRRVDGSMNISGFRGFKC